MRDFERRKSISRMRSKTLLAQYILLVVLALASVLTIFISFGNGEDGEAEQEAIDIEQEQPGITVQQEPEGEDVQGGEHCLIPKDKLRHVEDIQPTKAVPTEVLEDLGWPLGQSATIVDTETLGLFLQSVKDKSASELRAMAINDFDYNDFNDPEARRQVRGCVLQFRGSLRVFQRSQLPEKEAAKLRDYGITEVYEGAMQDAQHGIYTFRCTRNIGREWESGDLVELVGPFYKLIKYPSKKGEQGAPLLIVPKVVFVRRTPVQPVTKKITGGLPSWAIAVGLVVTGAVVVMLVLLLTRRKALYMRTEVAADVGDLEFEYTEPEAETESETEPDGEDGQESDEAEEEEPVGPEESEQSEEEPGASEEERQP